jgi:MFS family permease
MTTISLWRHGGFLRLWGGETTSQLGAKLGEIAIPVLAVVVLNASELEIGVLGAAGMAAFLVVGLPAGALIDRMLKRRVMLRADLVRAIAMGAIPLLWFLGVLEMWHLIVLATIVGIARVFFDVAYQSYIPVLVAREQISDANSKLETTSQLAGIGGPALGGALLTVVQAPVILLSTAVTYLVSFVMLSTIRDTEVPAPKEDRRPLWVEIREGMGFVWRQPLLRRIVAATATTNFFSTFAMTLLPILILRELGLSPAVLGVAFGIGAIGGLLGAAASNRLTKWIGEGSIIVWSSIACGVAGLLFACLTIVPDAVIVPLFVAAEFCLTFGVLVYNIAQVSFRQRICPTPLLGRMNASIRFVVWGVMPIAGLASGIVSTAIGVVPVIWIGMIGATLASGFVVFSPLTGMRTLPDSAVAQAENAAAELDD